MMIRCLCCNKTIIDPTDYESKVLWHKRCIKSFFGTDTLPELDCTEKELERLANLTVNKGLTVPGVQKKLSLHLSSEDRTARLTIVDYPTGYILKPQSPDFDYLPEAEFLTMKMADAVKIKTVPSALMYINDKFAYITKRIDRKNGSMYAMEDFCQLSGRMTEDKYRGSYENCAKIIKKYSRNVGLDIAEFYYRLLFCFVTGNSDMHLKNFSLIEEGAGSRQYGLSAAYDLLPVNLLMPSDTEQTALTLNGKKKNIKKKDFYALAENIGLNKKVAGGLMKEILRYSQKLSDLAGASYISDELRQKMNSLMEERYALWTE